MTEQPDVRALADKILQLAWVRFGEERQQGHGQSWCRDVWEKASAMIAAALSAAESRADLAERQAEDARAEIGRLEDAWFVDEGIQPDGSLRPSIKATIARAASAEEALREARQALEAAESVLWMAEEYAQAGGTHGPEMRDYEPAAEKVRAWLRSRSVPTVSSQEGE